MFGLAPILDGAFSVFRPVCRVSCLTFNLLLVVRSKLRSLQIKHALVQTENSLFIGLGGLI